MTKSDFTTQKQRSFRAAIASVLTIDFAQVLIIGIKTQDTGLARRSSAGGIAIVIQINCGGDTDKADSMVSKLNLQSINQELSSMNLPEATVLSAAGTKMLTASAPATRLRRH